MSGNTKDLARTQALILAGGEGQRLRPLTVSRPKPAVSFGGIFRVIDFTLSNCLYSGLDKVSLLTQYRYEYLHRYIQESWSERWKGEESRERQPLRLLPPSSGKQYRGTADAVFQNSELLQSDDTEFVLILSGDHIYRMDYGDFLRQHVESGADVTIATVEHPVSKARRFGVVEVDGNSKVTGFEEKPVNPRSLPKRPAIALVSMGVYLFRKKTLLESLHDLCRTNRGYDFGHHIIPSLIHYGRTYAYDFRDENRDSARYWRDIGDLNGYYDANMDLLRPDQRFNPYMSPFQCRDVEAQITRSIVSPDIELAEDVYIDESVIMPDVRIGKGARLRRTIVDEGVELPADYEVGFDLNQDRKDHTVTDRGIVVVSTTPCCTKPSVAYSPVLSMTALQRAEESATERCA